MGTFTGLEALRGEQHRLELGLFAANTRTGYSLDWALFRTWCEQFGYTALPAVPETVALYLTHTIATEKRKVSTASRRACAIAYYHRQAGLPSPVTREARRVLTGARRLRGERPRQMRPLTVEQLRQIAGALAEQHTATAARDSALLVLGLASGLRCSALTRLQLGDVDVVPKGLVLSIGRDKTDQEGRGRLIGLPYGEHPETCPVRSLGIWLSHRGDEPGPLFTRLDPGHEGSQLDRNRVRKIVQAALKRIGVDPAGYGGHSLRAGLVTEAAESGCSELVIAAQTGHRSMEVLRRYYRRAQLFRNNAAAMIGL